jgi:integrase
MQLPIPFPVQAELQTLYLEADRLRRAQMSPATLHDYEHDWRNFTAWCERWRRNPLPASGETVSLYVTDLLLRGKKVSTVKRYASGVAFQHRSRGHENPLTEAVRAILAGAQRTRREQPRQMEPITVDQLRAICAALRAKKTPVATRDRAIVLIGFLSALRRANLAELEMRDAEIRPDGIRIYVRREKNEEADRGRYLGLTPSKDPLICPVRAFEDWIDVRGSRPGFVFTRLDNGSKKPLERLTGNAVLVAVKKAARLAGLDARYPYGAHSLRAGFVTECGQKGIPHLVIAKQTGHRSMESLQRYFRPTDLWRSNACALLEL